MTILYSRGSEPVCPSCRRDNALLHDGYTGSVADLKCRDCGVMFVGGEYEVVKVNPCKKKRDPSSCSVRVEIGCFACPEFIKDVYNHKFKKEE